MSYFYPIILSGGVGSRLWPLSRRQFPKQLLNLVGEHSLIQETVLRAAGAEFAKPLIVCHADHRFLVAEQMRAVGIEPEKIVLEPTGRNTAPAAAIAALIVAEKQPDAVLLLMPADHVIGDWNAWREAMGVADDLSKRGHLVTFGIHPRSADTGYGYIQRGLALRDDEKAFAVRRFVEKPDAATAARYLEKGDYCWNSGMFAFQAETCLAELERLAPEILTCCHRALREGTPDGNFFHLAPDPFAACKSISIDYAVMERTDKAALVPVDMGWSDIGSWQALWDISERDARGNAVKGDVQLHDTHNAYVRSDGPLIAALGVKDLVVVASADAVLVSQRSASQDVKTLVERLERAGRDLHIAHGKTPHAWGTVERLDQGENFQVYRITVNVGAAYPLPNPATGRWVVAAGKGRIRRDDETFLLAETETYMPSGADDALENAGNGPLEIIEVRFGASSR